MRKHMLVVLAGAMACAGPAAVPQDVYFMATDFAYTGPDTIAPGVTTILMENHGDAPHHLILGRLAEGFTLADVMAYVDSNPTGEPPFLTWHGGAGTVLAHQGTSTTADLPAGHYVLLCFIPDASGVPHLALGMVKELVVAGTRHEAPLPEADLTIHMTDFAYDAIPTTAGIHTVRVVNDGAQTHEVQLVRLDEGATIEDYLAAVAPGAAGPPPGAEIGGSGALSPGGVNYWSADLTAGTYAIVCFVPDPGSGAPHAMLGMVRTFTIEAD